MPRDSKEDVLCKFVWGAYIKGAKSIAEIHRALFTTYTRDQVRYAVHLLAERGKPMQGIKPVQKPNEPDSLSSKQDKRRDRGKVQTKDISKTIERCAELKSNKPEDVENHFERLKLLKVLHYCPKRGYILNGKPAKVQDVMRYKHVYYEKITEHTFNEGAD